MLALSLRQPEGETSGSFPPLPLLCARIASAAVGVAEKMRGEEDSTQVVIVAMSG